MDASLRPLRLAATFLGLALLASCAASQPPAAGGETWDGLALGFWHGLIAPVTFLVSLFRDEVRIYAYPNLGRWYDLGFMMGIGGFSGGMFAGSRRAVLPPGSRRD